MPLGRIHLPGRGVCAIVVILRSPRVLVDGVRSDILPDTHLPVFIVTKFWHDGGSILIEYMNKRHNVVKDGEPDLILTRFNVDELAIIGAADQECSDGFSHHTTNSGHQAST